jgi:hypothetical protein
LRLKKLMGLAALAGIGAVHAQEVEDSNAKLQSTYVWQAKPSIRAPYEGAHSLQGAREKSYSFTATAAFGVRAPP